MFGYRATRVPNWMQNWTLAALIVGVLGGMLGLIYRRNRQ